MVLTFDSNLLADNGQDLQLLLPGFGKPSATYHKACFEHTITEFYILVSKWISPRPVVVAAQPLTFKE